MVRYCKRRSKARTTVECGAIKNDTNPNHLFFMMMIPFNTENLLSKANGFSENHLPHVKMRVHCPELAPKNTRFGCGSSRKPLFVSILPCLDLDVVDRCPTQ